MPNESHRTRPVQTAKRKTKPLGQEDSGIKKKSKTGRATANEENESTYLQGQEQSTPFISPEKYLGMEVMDDDEPPKEFVSPLQYMPLADEGEERPRTRHKKLAKKQGSQEFNTKRQTYENIPEDKESSTRASDSRMGSTQQSLHVEKPNETASDRFVITAQQDLLQMIGEGASDMAVENQLKIIKMLRARLPSQVDEPRKLNPPNKNVPEPFGPKPGPRHPLSIPSDSDSEANISSPPTPSPARNKHRKRTPSAKVTTNLETKELLKTARPASAPTSLPATQRTNRSLTAAEVAELSTVHPSFDEKETNKLDRHTRKLNSTRSMASDRPAVPERGLESRIRAPTSSPEPEEIPRGRAGAAKSNEYRLDAAALRAVDSAATAAGAAAGGPQSFGSGGRSTAADLPGKGKGKGKGKGRANNASPEGPGESAGATFAPLDPLSRRPATSGGRSGQVWNEGTKPRQYQYVEEVDTDDD